MLWANAASSATAQVTQCQLPTDIPAPRPVAPPRDEPRRIVPVAGYTLALSWSPQFCARAFGRSSEFQCSRRAAPFGFILHGLWPEGAGRDWPQYCHPAQLVPRDVIRANLCAMPSVQMIQHEWARHGTCSSDSPQRYFSTARTLFERLRLPDMAMLARRRDLTAGQFIQAIVVRNPGVRPDMLRIRSTYDGWLDEIWICLDRSFTPARCAANKGGRRGTAPLHIRAPN